MLTLNTTAAQVVMCHNHMQSATEFENMLVHELVHAFDHCRGRDLDWTDCRHHACSEARCHLPMLCSVCRRTDTRAHDADRRSAPPA